MNEFIVIAAGLIVVVGFGLWAVTSSLFNRDEIDYQIKYIKTSNKKRHKMQLSTTLKAVVMMIITMVATLIQQHGMPATGRDWIIAGISILGTVLVYLGKNIVLPSTSTIFNINVQDAISGLIVAVGAGISSWIATVVADVPLNWGSLWDYTISVVIGYLVSLFARGYDREVKMFRKGI